MKSIKQVVYTDHETFFEDNKDLVIPTKSGGHADVGMFADNMRMTGGIALKTQMGKVADLQLISNKATSKQLKEIKKDIKNKMLASQTK